MIIALKGEQNMKILAIDGNSIINRAFYGIRPLTTKSGEYTNGIYGFINILFKLLDETNPDGVVVAFDLKAPTFRHKMYDDYKAGRKPMPTELASQFPLLKTLIELLGYTYLECEGYEADDILGTIARKSEQSGDECVIATGDRDSFQLISEKTAVRFTATKMGAPSVTVYDKQKILEEYGLSPRQLIDVKAIEGDKSDNIPGVAGIGKVGAQKLIQSYGSLDGVYANIESSDIKPAMREKLIADKENAYLSLKIGEIFCDVPCVKELSEYTSVEPDKEKLKAFLIRLEFYKAISRLGLDDVVSTDVNTAPETKIVFSRLQENFETAIEKAEKIDFYYTETESAICIENKILKITLEQIKSLLPYCSKIRVFDYKNLYSELKAKEIDLSTVTFDASLAAYLINPDSNDYSPDRLISEYSVELPKFEFESEPCEEYAAKLSMLCNLLDEKIKEFDMQNLLCNIEIPLARVLSNMENEGFLIDADKLTEFGDELSLKLTALEDNIYELAGEKFNINSPKQLAVILFEKLGLPARKKTKSGYSTNVEVLESLRGYHDIIGEILEYRTLAKLKSTYVDGFLKIVSGDGRIHTKFNQKETRTGRISSSEPNLQNIPVRKDVGRNLRKFFIASEGKTLVDADYSQIELRVLADISNDPAMIDAFNNDEDIHTLTASQVFGFAPVFIDSSLRSRAKAVNFGIIYGIGAFSLSKDIGVSRAEADKYIKGYLDTYKGVADYMESTIGKAKENGYVTTTFNRRRYLPELASSNANLRNFGERVARNMPIQGTAADIIKIAMINVSNRLEKENMKSRLILQVHDELIVEATDDEADKVVSILKEEMENAVKLKVKLIVDIGKGKSWYDSKG